MLFLYDHCRPAQRRLAETPDRQQRGILLATFDQADMGPINTHARANLFLTQPSFRTVTTDIGSHQSANVHPQGRRQRRASVLRMIILITRERRWTMGGMNRAGFAGGVGL